jgi:hypothetical protein
MPSYPTGLAVDGVIVGKIIRKKNAIMLNSV